MALSSLSLATSKLKHLRSVAKSQSVHKFGLARAPLSDNLNPYRKLILRCTSSPSRLNSVYTTVRTTHFRLTATTADMSARFGLRAIRFQPFARQSTPNTTTRFAQRRSYATAGAAANPAAPGGVAGFWNSPVGPKTVHFWAPVMKVCHLRFAVRGI